MTLELFAHPFSSYCQKALIAFYENDIPFTYRMMEDPGVGEELASLWPIVSIGVQTGPPIGAQKGPPFTMAQG